MIDTSSSVSGIIEGYVDALYALGKALTSQKNGVTTQYMTFNTKLSPFISWETQSKLPLKAEGQTSLFDTIAFIDEYLNTLPANNNQQEISILITDGMDNNSKQNLENRKWKTLDSTKHKFFTIGIGKCDTQTLAKISEINQTPWIHGENTLDELKEKVLKNVGEIQKPRAAITVLFQAVGGSWEPLTVRFASKLRLYSPEEGPSPFVVGSNLQHQDQIYTVWEQPKIPHSLTSKEKIAKSSEYLAQATKAWLSWAMSKFSFPSAGQEETSTAENSAPEQNTLLSTLITKSFNLGKTLFAWAQATSSAPSVDHDAALSVSLHKPMHAEASPEEGNPDLPPQEHTLETRPS